MQESFVIDLNFAFW